MKIQIFLDLTLCVLVNIYYRFGRAYCLCFHDQAVHFWSTETEDIDIVVLQNH